MIFKLTLAVILGFNLCGLSWGEEVKEKEAVHLNATPPHEVAQELEEESQPQPEPAKSPAGKEKEALPAAPQAANPLSVKIIYKGHNLDEWQLYDQKERLAALIKYKNNRPIRLQLFDANGSPRDGIFRTAYPNGKLKVMKTYRRGIQLTEEGYYETGQLQYKMKKRKNGQIAGFRAYGKDGKLNNGSYKEYYPNGQLKGIGSFRRGLPEGDFVSFCQDGQVFAEKQFKKGRLLSKNWKENADPKTCADVFVHLDSDITPIITVTSPQPSCSAGAAQSARL